MIKVILTLIIISVSLTSSVMAGKEGEESALIQEHQTSSNFGQKCESCLNCCCNTVCRRPDVIIFCAVPSACVVAGCMGLVYLMGGFTTPHLPASLIGNTTYADCNSACAALEKLPNVSHVGYWHEEKCSNGHFCYEFVNCTDLPEATQIAIAKRLKDINDKNGLGNSTNCEPEFNTEIGGIAVCSPRSCLINMTAIAAEIGIGSEPESEDIPPLEDIDQN